MALPPASPDNMTNGPVAGYLGKGRLDTSWWQTQIQAGIKFRQRHSQEDKWARWDSMYEGKFSSNILPVNLFFMMARTLIPKLYFRNPSISVTPGQPGPEQLGLTMLNERISNKLMKSMNIKREFKAITQETFFHGTSFGKIGFGSEFSAPKAGESEVPQTGRKDWAKVDYHQGITGNEPWFLRTPANQVVYPAGTQVAEASPWIAHIIRRPTDDVRNDDRLQNTKKLSGDSTSSENRLMEDTQGIVPMTEMYEVWDRRTNQHFIITSDTNNTSQELLPPEESTMITRNGGPLYKFAFNQTNTSCWGLPDPQILEPFQREINEIATQIMYHRRLTMRKFIARRGSITEEEAQAMVLADISNIGAVIWVNEPNQDIVPLQISDIPQSLFTAFDRIMQMVQFTLGFSRNQFGEFRQGSEAATAKEASIVQQSSEIRIDERRDMLADILVSVMQDTMQMAYQYWEEDMVERVVGPWGVPIWVKFNGEMLRQGQYEVNVDADSGSPQTKEGREAKAVQMFQLLYPLTQQPNPLTGQVAIDPQKLVRFLMHEMQGTQYDDMLMGVPNIYNENFIRQLEQGMNNLTEPVSPEQLGQMTQKAQNGGEVAAIGQLLGG